MRTAADILTEFHIELGSTQPGRYATCPEMRKTSRNWRRSRAASWRAPATSGAGLGAGDRLDDATRLQHKRHPRLTHHRDSHQPDAARLPLNWRDHAAKVGPCNNGDA
jgi:hypothetical protein